MSFSKKCRHCSVKVENGTGVLVSPNTEEYSYILTAKHNLYHDYENKKCTESKSLDSIKLVAYDESIKLSLLGKYELDECGIDIAILKIEKVNTCAFKIKLDEPKNGQKYFLYGFPKHRRDDKFSKEEQIRNFELKVVDKLSNHEIIVENDKYYSQSDIDGCSGGGVFENINEESFLAGIEFRMDRVGKKDDNNTRLRFFSIKAFDKIVDKYSNELVYLDDTKNFNKKYNVEETVIDLGSNKSIVLKTVPVEIDEVDSDGKNKKKILNVSIYPVTFEEYNNFRKINCHYTDNEKSEYPIVNINWNDAEAYCLWLGHKIHKKIRMLTSKEWNFLIKTIYNDKVSDYCTFSSKKLEKIDNISEDNLGLYNIIGNIKEWCWDGKDDKKYIKGLAFSDNLKKIDKLLKDNMVHKSTYKNNRGFRIVF